MAGYCHVKQFVLRREKRGRGVHKTSILGQYCIYKFDVPSIDCVVRSYFCTASWFPNTVAFCDTKNENCDILLRIFTEMCIAVQPNVVIRHVFKKTAKDSIIAYFFSADNCNIYCEELYFLYTQWHNLYIQWHWLCASVIAKCLTFVKVWCHVVHIHCAVVIPRTDTLLVLILCQSLNLYKKDPQRTWATHHWYHCAWWLHTA